jgi:hypothetical protein
VQEHAFDNLILLCANCHARADRDIDRSAMKTYKANLGLIGGRYGDLERRVLEWFTVDPSRREIIVDRSHDFLLTYLVEDGIIDPLGPAEGAFYLGTGTPSDADLTGVYGPLRWGLTDAGQRLIGRLRRAEEVD